MVMDFTAFAKSIKPYNKYSQFYEDSIIEAIFERIGTANKWCVECGAADGVFFSNTRRLIEQGWRSMQIEANEKLYARLADLYKDNANVVTTNVRVGSQDGSRFDDLFSGLPKDIDLLVIDVDGQDYHLWNQLSAYQPRAVICEFDPNADPDFIPTIGGDGQAGERAIHHVALARGYQVVCKTWCNLICVRNDLCHLLSAPTETCFPLESMGAMRPVIEAMKEPEPQSEDKPESDSEPEKLIGGHTEQDFIEAKAQRARDCNFMLAACMSTPRWGPLSTMDVVLNTVAAWSVPYFRSEGAYWHHQLTTAIEDALKVHPDAIVTFDYDSLFCSAPNQNDIARLVTLLIENPDVDVVAPMQIQREGGLLIANSDSGELTVTEPLTPVWFAHFGATVFRSSVFDRIKKPWFWEKPDPSGGWREGRTDPDTGFWLNCKESGITVCYALDVVLGHGEYGPTYPDDQFRPIRMSLNEWRKNGMKPPPDAFNRQRVIEAALAGTMPGAKVNGQTPEPRHYRAVETLLDRA